MTKNETVQLEMYLHHETDKAILVSDDGDKENAKWFAKSVIEYEKDGGRHEQIVYVTLPEWLAMKEGLI